MIIGLILATSSLVHFIRFGFPYSVVFDEVFYGNFTSYYWQGAYFFDQHPPFFKLLIAFIGQIFNLNNLSANWDSIGNEIPLELVMLRLIPLIAGILLPLVLYAISRRLNFSKISSLVIALLICLENSLIVQSRFILPDIFMLTTGFSSILFYLEYHKRLDMPRRSLFLLASIILSAIAFSIKWTGVTFLFLIIVIESYRLITESVGIKLFFKKISGFIGKYIIISAIIYVTLFAIHFSILPFSGKGDVFMTPSFQKTLTNNQYSSDDSIVKKGFVSKFIELNKVMFTANSGMTATHPNSSKWYTWPIMQRSIFYWQNNTTSSDSKHSYIYLLGNPFIYWFGTLSVLALILVSISKLITKKKLSNDPETSKVIIFITIGYLANLLPFMLIGRVMFLYHYETALIFSIIAIGFVLDAMQPKKKIVATIIVLAIALSAFIYWSPLTYGTPLTDTQMKSRMWFSSWR